MSKIILVAGYTKKSYLSKIRAHYKGSNILLACAYSRRPHSEVKTAYLSYFDVCYDLEIKADRDRLKLDASNVLLVTCTQERDMIAYIDAQLLCGKITDEQAHNYRILIDKEYFKKSLQKIYPELVPELHVITPELLDTLDTLTYPLVIKPTGLAGSTLVKIVSNAAELQTHYETFSETMHKFGNEIYQKQIHVIAEAFISGPQFSMNVYVDRAGKITFCPLVRVVTPSELGINDTYSALQYTSDELSSEEVEQLKNAITKIVNHFKVTCTSMHFDCVLHHGQWKFFEAGLRIGGNRQKLFELSHGMDHFLNDLLNRTGTSIQIPHRIKTACIVQKAAVTHGRLLSIGYQRLVDSLQKTLITEGKIAKIGKETGPVSTGGGTSTRHFVFGKDQAEVIAVSTKLFSDITIKLC